MNEKKEKSASLKRESDTQEKELDERTAKIIAEVQNHWIIRPQDKKEELYILGIIKKAVIDTKKLTREEIFKALSTQTLELMGDLPLSFAIKQHDENIRADEREKCEKEFEKLKKEGLN